MEATHLFQIQVTSHLSSHKSSHKWSHESLDVKWSLKSFGYKYGSQVKSQIIWSSQDKSRRYLFTSQVLSNLITSQVKSQVITFGSYTNFKTIYQWLVFNQVANQAYQWVLRCRKLLYYVLNSIKIVHTVQDNIHSIKWLSVCFNFIDRMV